MGRHRPRFARSEALHSQCEEEFALVWALVEDSYSADSFTSDEGKHLMQSEGMSLFRLVVAGLHSGIVKSETLYGLIRYLDRGQAARQSQRTLGDPLRSLEMVATQAPVQVCVGIFA